MFSTNKALVEVLDTTRPLLPVIVIVSASASPPNTKVPVDAVPPAEIS